jgi:hypothetical protein
VSLSAGRAGVVTGTDSRGSDRAGYSRAELAGAPRPEQRRRTDPPVRGARDLLSRALPRRRWPEEDPQDQDAQVRAEAWEGWGFVMILAVTTAPLALFVIVR